MSTLQLTKVDYNLLKSILSKYPYHFYAYGSRVKETTRKFSDLDLCYSENIPADILCQIEEKFEESDLPFVVELVCWNDMRSSFQKSIEKDLVLISAPAQIRP